MLFQGFEIFQAGLSMNLIKTNLIYILYQKYLRGVATKSGLGEGGGVSFKSGPFFNCKYKLGIKDSNISTSS